MRAFVSIFNIENKKQKDKNVTNIRTIIFHSWYICHLLLSVHQKGKKNDIFEQWINNSADNDVENFCASSAKGEDEKNGNF